jgi:predicted ferric reductase
MTDYNTNLEDEQFFQEVQFYEEIEELCKKYNVVLAVYTVDDVAGYLQYVHSLEVDESNTVAQWIWQNTKLAKDIRDHLNNTVIPNHLFENGYEAYKNRKEQ